MFYRIFLRFSVKNSISRSLYWTEPVSMSFFWPQNNRRAIFNMIYLYINWIENFGAKSTNYCIENNDKYNNNLLMEYLSIAERNEKKPMETVPNGSRIRLWTNTKLLIADWKQ